MACPRNFGYGHTTHRGTKAVLEVRPHDVPFLMEDGQLFCKLCVESTAETPEVAYGAALQSHCQTQTLTLGKQFLPWETVAPRPQPLLPIIA